MVGSGSSETVDLSYEKDSDILEDSSEDVSKIQSAKFVPVRCVTFEDDYRVRAHHSKGTVDLYLDEFMSKSSSDSFLNNYEDGEIAYLTCFRIPKRDSSGVYVENISLTKEEAVESKHRIRRVADIYNRIYHSSIEEKLNFGLKHRIDDNNRIFSNIHELTGKIIILPQTIPLYILYVVLFFYGGLTLSIIASILFILTSVLLAFNTWVDRNTLLAVECGDNCLMQRDFSDTNKVVVADINENTEQVEIIPDNLGTKWSFDKNTFGDVVGPEGKVLDDLDSVGDERVVFRVSRNLTGVEGVESTDGHYVMSKYDYKCKWVL